jgi:hypothetical protein
VDLRAVDTGEVNVYLEPGRYLPVLCPVGRQVLSPEERRIAAYVDTHGAEAVKLLERTVNINSETLNPAFGISEPSPARRKLARLFEVGRGVWG